VVQGVARDLNIAKAAGDAVRAGSCHLIRSMGGFGTAPARSGSYLKRGLAMTVLSDSESRAVERARLARAAKNFAESDRIRDA